MGISRIWKTAIYIRISKENGEDTLENQLNVIEKHLSMLGSIKVCSVKVDDGYSGLHSDRPAFQEMLHEIKCGQIDCIAVRDLSRLSRNYIEAGRFIHDIFPANGIRFISVSEGYDFIKPPEHNIMMMVSFRNLVNEEYSRNLSLSVKSALSQRYAEGKFLGAFPVYGYRKSTGNRHQLEVDPLPARIVRDIFQWKLEGMSAAAIVELLNQGRIPSPAEHKKQTNFYTSFQKNACAKWTPAAVGRILVNRIYTGCLEQGKSIRPYFKANNRIVKPHNEWICTENAHTPIIKLAQFEAVSRVLLMDTRCTPSEKVVPALAGFVRCKNCNQNMILKQNNSKSRTYYYYVCGGKNQDNKPCPSHRIPQAELEEAVLCQLHSRIDDVIKVDKTISLVDTSLINEIRTHELTQELHELISELELNQEYHKGLYSAFALRVHTDSELDFMRSHYKHKCDLLKDKIQETEKIISNNHGTEKTHEWIELYKPFFTFEEITRPMLAYLVHRVTVDGNKEAQVEFLHEREYRLFWEAIDKC